MMNGGSLSMNSTISNKIIHYELDKSGLAVHTMDRFDMDVMVLNELLESLQVEYD